MNNVKLRDYLKGLIEPLGYKLYFGTRSMYNTRKEISDRVVIVEPYTLRLHVPGLCEYDTELRFWVGVRRELEQEFNNEQGDDAPHIDKMITEAGKIIKEIKGCNKLSITQRVQAVDVTYYEADQTATANMQSFIVFTLPLRTYGFGD
jgi:hypothetical protein